MNDLKTLAAGTLRFVLPVLLAVVLVILIAGHSDNSAKPKGAYPESAVTQPTHGSAYPGPTGTQTGIAFAVAPTVELVYWKIGDQPVVTSRGFTVAVHMLVGDGSRLTVVYSVSGPNVDQSFVAKSVQLTDQTGTVSYIPCPPAFPAVTRTPAAYLALTALSQPLPTETVPPYPVVTQPPPPPPPPCTPGPARSVVTPLGQVGQLLLEAVTFASPMSAARELHLLINPADGAKPLDVFAAKVTGQVDPNALYPLPGDLFRDGYLDQASYRVSFNGFVLARGDRTAQVIPTNSGFDKGVATAKAIEANRATAVPMTEKPRPLLETQAAAAASWSPQPPGQTSTPAWDSPDLQALTGGQLTRLPPATLRLEDLQSHQVQYMFIAFMADGGIKATLVR